MRFYPAFQVCTTLPALSRRIAEETPEYDRWGIHALVSQTADGALTLGDSHEYGLAVDIFNKEEIDEIILRYTRQFLRAPDLNDRRALVRRLCQASRKTAGRDAAGRRGPDCRFARGLRHDVVVWGGRAIDARLRIHSCLDHAQKSPRSFSTGPEPLSTTEALRRCNALENIFDQFGITVPRPLVRRYMGLAKKDHIRKLLEEPEVNRTMDCAAPCAAARA